MNYESLDSFKEGGGYIGNYTSANPKERGRESSLVHGGVVVIQI